MKRNDVPERRGGDRRKGDRRRQDRKKFDFKILILLALVGGVVFLWLSRKGEEEEAAAQMPVPVRITYPERGTIQRTFRISGYVESESMVTVLPKISGTLTELFVDMGDRVTKGEIIGLVDSEPYALTLRQAEAAYLAAKSTFERMEQMYSANATSKQNYDQAKSQYDAMKSQWELAKLNFTYTNITAPVSGVVLQKHTPKGSLVAQEVPIVTIGDLEHLVINAKIPEKYYAFFATRKESMEIEVRLPALEDREIHAKIKTVSPYISPETKNFEVVCTLQGETELLRPGMFLYLTFILDKREDVYYLPFDVLLMGNTLWYVDRENSRGNKLSYEPPFFNNDVFQIAEEYADYPIIIEGHHFLREGQEVRVLNEPEITK